MNTQEIKITNAQTISINAKMQDKVVTPSLEQQTILPDENYNSLSKVVVNAVTLENKIVHPNRDTQIITPTESLGLSSVTVEPVSLEEKSIVPKKEVQVLNPSNEYVGFSQVTVEKIPEEYIIPNGNLDIKNNGDFDVTENATVNVNVQLNLQEKETRITAPTNIFVHPDEEYDGLSFVNVIASVDTETKEVTPTKEAQNISRSDDKYIESVTVNAIPDNYIEPSGEMEITENGSYDVKDKASVKVETSGADLSEYFTETISSGSNSKGGWIPTFLKLPPLKNTGTSCAYMFKSCTAQEIDLSKFDTSNVTNMSNMFSSCAYLKSLDLSNFDTSKVTNMSSMFFGSDSIEKINVSNFDTSNVTDMNGMFRNLYTTTEIKGLNNFDTSKVTNMEYMFQNSSKLTSLDLSNFDTSNCSLFNYMFDCNYSFDTLNIGNFDFSKVQGGSYGKGMADIFRFFTGLVNLTFGVNFGKGFTGKSANNTYSKLDLSRNVNLSHDSLIDVINKLYDLNLTYDVANGGTLYTQQLVLGETNLAKLTEDEIAIATNKGWTVS